MVEQIPTNKPNLEKSDEREVVFKEVAELELPIKIIIEKIRPRIENGEYGLIIGDDASGRIPTLILGNFIRKTSEQKGLDKPNIVFIPGKLLLYPILDSTVNVPKLEKYLLSTPTIADIDEDGKIDTFVVATSNNTDVQNYRTAGEEKNIL